MPAWLHLMGESLGPLLYAGLVFTVPLTIVSFVLGLALAFVVALIRLFGPAWSVAIVRFYVWLIRGSPLLVQLFVIFYGWPPRVNPQEAVITCNEFPDPRFKDVSCFSFQAGTEFGGVRS